MRRERQFSTETLLHARAGLLALDSMDPNINQVVIGNAAAWLGVKAINVPGAEDATTPETTVYSFKAARQVIKNTEIPGMDKAAKRKIRKALKQKRKDMERAQTPSENADVIHNVTVNTAAEEASIASDHSTAAIATSLMLGANVTTRFFSSSQSSSDE